jgi:hypothetical protein
MPRNQLGDAVRCGEVRGPSQPFPNMKKEKGKKRNVLSSKCLFAVDLAWSCSGSSSESDMSLVPCPCFLYISTHQTGSVAQPTPPPL